MKKAKYRLLVITMSNSRKEFHAQYKGYFLWRTILYDGDTIPAWISKCETDTRKKALDRIDKHYQGNTKIQSIEFEYIDK